MIFGSKPKLSKLPSVPMTLSININKVEQIHSLKYLEVIVDKSLNFNDHKDNVYKLGL